MKIRHALNLSTVAVVLAGGTSLMAQVTTGALNGRVTDSTGKPLAGARVSLESAALFQPRTMTTDAKGEFRALLLPVGNYTVKVSAANYIGKTNADVRIGVGANLTLDFALKAAKEATATVEVSADMAQTSKTDDKVSANFSAEKLEQLPTDRTFSGALILAPGITGSGTDAQVRGSGTNQINYRIDGIDVKDDTGSSQSLYEPLQDSIEDVQVVLSALNARNGRSQGGQVNVVTKSGSNTFEGTIRNYQSRLSWTADRPFADNATKNSNAAEDLSHKTDITISGPIWKDRIWFYFGTRLAPSTSEVGHPVGVDGQRGSEKISDVNQTIITTPLNTYGNYPGVDGVLLNGTGLPAGYSLRAGWQDLNSPVIAKTDFKKYEGKITAMVTDNNILTFTYLYQKSTSGGSASEGQGSRITLDKRLIGDATDKVTGYTVGLNSNLASNWTLEMRYFKATHDKSNFYTHLPGYDGGSVYGYFSTGSLDPNKMFSQTDGNGDTATQAFWGEFNVITSASAPAPTRAGNDGLTLNIKTFQDLAGQHEIDFGGELFYTVNNVGRSRNHDLGIWTGGYFTNLSAAPGSEYLFPVFHSTNGQLWNTTDDTLPTYVPKTGQFVRYDDFNLRTSSATIEKFWARSSNTKNHANSFWFNDIYTINSNWNVMVGLRSNSFKADNNGGGTMNSLSLIEPRLQVKWDPAGNSKNVFSLSWAKLASAFSDQIMQAYRANEWNAARSTTGPALPLGLTFRPWIRLEPPMTWWTA